MNKPTKTMTNQQTKQMSIEEMIKDYMGNDMWALFEDEDKREIVPTSRFAHDLGAVIEKRLETLIAEREKKVAKAYGGCEKCYGKGWGTATEYLHGAEDMSGDKAYDQKLPTMRFCDCDRGKQLERAVTEQERLARIDELERFRRSGLWAERDDSIALRRIAELQQHGQEDA